jgi:hypothetical protein
MLKVESLNSKRFEIALEQLRSGDEFQFDGVSFWADTENSKLNISTTSNWRAENLDDAKALSEIRRAESIFKYLLESSEEFAEAVANLEPRFSVYDDYGMGTIELCHLSGSHIVWR